MKDAPTNPPNPQDLMRAREFFAAILPLGMAAGEENIQRLACLLTDVRHETLKSSAVPRFRMSGLGASWAMDDTPRVPASFLRCPASMSLSERDRCVLVIGHAGEHLYDAPKPDSEPPAVHEGWQVPPRPFACEVCGATPKVLHAFCAEHLPGPERLRSAK